MSGFSGGGVSASDLALKAPIASPTFTGTTTAPFYVASGLTGATQASRYVGATASGAPASGTFAIGDFVIDRSGKIYVCTTAGTPGTWGQVGGSGGATIGTGALADRPAAGTAGNMYLPSDAPYAYRDTGAAWVPWGVFPQLPAPVLGDFSWDNQGSATVSQANGTIVISGSGGNGSWQNRVLYKAAPATPYKLDALFSFYPSINGAVGGGIGWRESSSGKLVLINPVWSQSAIYLRQWTNSTTYSGDFGTLGYFLYATGSPFWCFRIEDDGVNRSVSFLIDGYTPVPLLSHGRTSFITADQLCFQLTEYSASVNSAMALWSWKVW